MKNQSICGICGERIPAPFSAIVYSDNLHGIPEMVNIHRRCYRAHILKYWPDSRIANYLRNNPGEYTTEDEPRG